jgi:putative ABC transport system permease protein
MADPRTIYRLLLKLYPARFCEEYSGPLERQFRDDYREARGPAAKSWFWLHALADLALSIPAEIFREVRQDLHYAARIYRQRTATTALALAALALAIGATTGVFSVVNALLLRSLPFREPERLAQLWRAPLSNHFDRGVFRNWVAGSPYLADAAAYQSADVNLAQTHGAVRIKLAETSAGFFAVLGAEPAIGRGSTRQDRRGHHQSRAVAATIRRRPARVGPDHPSQWSAHDRDRRRPTRPGLPRTLCRLDAHGVRQQPPL